MSFNTAAVQPTSNLRAPLSPKGYHETTEKAVKISKSRAWIDNYFKILLRSSKSESEDFKAKLKAQMLEELGSEDFKMIETLFFQNFKPNVALTQSQEIRKKLQISPSKFESSLPIDLWGKVINVLVEQTNSWQELGWAALSCKFFWQILDTDHLNAFLNKSPSGLDISQILKISYLRWGNEKSFVCKLGDAGFNLEKVTKAFDNMKGLTSIELHSNHMDDYFAGVLSRDMRQLTFLKIVNGKMSDKGLILLAHGLRQLKHLSLENCGLMTNAGFKKLAFARREMVSLEFKNCTQLQDNAIDAIYEYCKELEVLRVVENLRHEVDNLLSGTSVENIFKNLNKLKVLDLRGTKCTITEKNLIAAKSRSNSLQTLILPESEITGKGLVEFISGADKKGLPNLSVLHIESIQDLTIGNLEDILNNASNLIELHINSVSNHKLQEQNLKNLINRYPHLKTIKIDKFLIEKKSLDNGLDQ